MDDVYVECFCFPYQLVVRVVAIPKSATIFGFGRAVVPDSGTQYWLKIVSRRGLGLRRGRIEDVLAEVSRALKYVSRGSLGVVLFYMCQIGSPSLITIQTESRRRSFLAFRVASVRQYQVMSAQMLLAGVQAEVGRTFLERLLSAFCKMRKPGTPLSGSAFRYVDFVSTNRYRARKLKSKKIPSRRRAPYWVQAKRTHSR